MPTKNQLSENKKMKSRLEILKTWMSSFVMATAAIIATVVLIPSSPKASILDVSVFQSEIIYQVMVTDQDEAIDLNTLTITLSNQFGQVSKSLQLGMNVGIFEDLNPNTLYYLGVYGSKGFGNEKLDERVVKTKERSGGAIISSTLVEAFEWNYHYDIEVFIKDEENLFGNIYLYYAYIYEEIIDPIYERISITSSREIIELQEVPTYNNRVHLYLEAELLEGGTTILDELYFSVPFRLESSIYLEHIDKHLIEYSIYPDMYNNVDVAYVFDIYFGKQKIDSKVVRFDLNEETMHSSSTYVTFDQLKKNTLYQVVVSASYQNPITLRNETVILQQEEVTTLGDFEIDFEITKTLDSYQVYVYLNDPNHYFQNVSYVLYDKTSDFQTYIEGMTYGFIPDLNGKYQNFSFNIPNVEKYQIVIRVSSDSEYTIYHLLMDETIKP